MEFIPKNTGFSIRVDTTAGRKLYLDIAGDRAPGTLVLTAGPDGALAIYLCKTAALVRPQARQRAPFAAWCIAWWKALVAACLPRGFKKLSPSG